MNNCQNKSVDSGQVFAHPTSEKIKNPYPIGNAERATQATTAHRSIKRLTRGGDGRCRPVWRGDRSRSRLAASMCYVAPPARQPPFCIHRDDISGGRHADRTHAIYSHINKGTCTPIVSSSSSFSPSFDQASTCSRLPTPHAPHMLPTCSWLLPNWDAHHSQIRMLPTCSRLLPQCPTGVCASRVP